jgi:hypothetical protein
MPDTIQDGTTGSARARVTGDNRLLTDTLTEPISSERSQVGKLFGIGTGGITPTSSFSLGPVLWLRNDSNTEDLYVQKIIFGWNGGSTNFNRTILSFIKYNTTVPTGNNTAISDQIENISRSGASSAISSGVVTAHKWDGVGTGMTGSTNGYLQIPNRLAQGNTSISIDGEIILGVGNSMEFQVTPEETGEFHVSVVYYFAPAGKGRSSI